MIAMILTAACFTVALFDLAPADSYDYEKLLDPVIYVHVVDDLTGHCGKVTQGCAVGNAETCDIYVGERASPNVIAHEKRHCYGWDHTEDQMAMVRPWYPKINLASNQE